MPNRNYEKGRRLEWDCMEYLEKRGYYTMRAYASRGDFDVIAVRPQYDPPMIYYPLLISCKTNNYVPPKEREALAKRSKELQGWVMVCYRDKGVKFRDLEGQIISHL